MRSGLKIFAVFFLIVLHATSCKKESDLQMHTYNTTVNLAYSSAQSDPSCFLDIDSGKVYKVSQAAAKQNEIDFVYVLRYNAANDPRFISLGSFDGKQGYPISYWNKSTLGINAFSFFNHTLISKGGSSNTLSGFASIKTVNDFNVWLNGNSAIFDAEEISTNEVGNIYLFKTQQNKRGAFRVVNAQNGSSGFATIEVKIEP
jgi:hypothetical protein